MLSLIADASNSSFYTFIPMSSGENSVLEPFERLNYAASACCRSIDHSASSTAFAVWIPKKSSCLTMQRMDLLYTSWFALRKLFPMKVIKRNLEKDIQVVRKAIVTLVYTLTACKDQSALFVTLLFLLPPFTISPSGITNPLE